MKTKVRQLVFATQNQNKVVEVQQLLPSPVKIKSLKEVGCFDDIPENQTTLEGNALQKAQYVYQYYGVDCFADDTGLEIEALNGEPGVFSARYAGNQKNSKKNIELVLEKLKGVNNRNAQFRTVIAYISKGKELLFEGIVKGVITTELHGEQGFGYDPIFKPENANLTFAQMSMNEKNKWSHRGKALKQFIANIS